MRLLPLQIDMFLLCGHCLPFVEPDELSLRQRVSDAHDSLVKQTGQDFSYDLNAWHEFLCDGDGYTWSNKHRTIAVAIRDALANPDWLAAVADIESDASAGR